MRKVAGCLVSLVLVSGCTTAVSGVAAPAPEVTSSAAPPLPTPPLPTPPLPTPPLPTPSPSTPAAGSFSDAGNRFAIAPPSGWSTDTTGTQGTAVVFRAPADGGRFRANINVIVVPATAALDAIIVRARQELRTLPDYTVTDDAPTALADGTPAHLLGGTFTDTGSGAALRNLQIFTVRGRHGVVVTGTAPAASWASFASPVGTSLRTLEVAE